MISKTGMWVWYLERMVSLALAERSQLAALSTRSTQELSGSPVTTMSRQSNTGAVGAATGGLRPQQRHGRSGEHSTMLCP